MALLDPDRVPDLPLAFQNDDHRAEVRLLNDAVDAVDGYREGAVDADTVVQRLDALAFHTREHFAREEKVMRMAGFPAYPMHKSEHDRVAAQLEREAANFREARESGRLRAYLTETLPVWLVGHIQTMDLVTARFVTAESRPAAP